MHLWGLGTYQRWDFDGSMNMKVSVWIVSNKIGFEIIIYTLSMNIKSNTNGAENQFYTILSWAMPLIADSIVLKLISCMQFWVPLDVHVDSWYCVLQGYQQNNKLWLWGLSCIKYYSGPLKSRFCLCRWCVLLIQILSNTSETCFICTVYHTAAELKTLQGLKT